MITFLIVTPIMLGLGLLLTSAILEINLFIPITWKGILTDPKPGEIYYHKDYKPTKDPFKRNLKVKLIYIVDKKDGYIQYYEESQRLEDIPEDITEEHIENIQQKVKSRYLASEKRYIKMIQYPHKLAITREQKLDIV